MKLQSFEDLLVDQLKDLYSAEKQLTKALPKMAKNASSDQLRQALTEHLGETEQHVERLEQIGETLGVKLSGKKCKGMEGLIEEGAESLEISEDENLSDIAIIAAGQRVEHYEISGYGTAKAIANELGYEKVVELLSETEAEEIAADEKLTQIVTSEIYPALHSKDETQEDEEEDVDEVEDGEETSARGKGKGRSWARM
jgi:ferritin-like metal-binding protein YciE